MTNRKLYRRFMNSNMMILETALADSEPKIAMISLKFV